MLLLSKESTQLVFLFGCLRSGWCHAFTRAGYHLWERRWIFHSNFKNFESVFRSQIFLAFLRDKSPYLNLFCLLTCCERPPHRVWCISPNPVAAFVRPEGWYVRFHPSDCFWSTLNFKLIFHHFSHFLPFFKTAVSVAQFYEIRPRLCSFLAWHVAWGARKTA